jgi:hypothetical protein
VDNTKAAPDPQCKRMHVHESIEAHIPQMPPAEVSSNLDNVPIRQKSVEVQIPLTPTVMQGIDDVRICQESVEVEIPPQEAMGVSDEEAMDWEDELHEQTDVAPSAEIRGWEVLRAQIDRDLKKGEKTLPVSQSRKLLLIQNFATLHLKGLGRMEASQQIALQWHNEEGTHFARQIWKLACHYQIFEQLPQEKRGGVRKG